MPAVSHVPSGSRDVPPGRPIATVDVGSQHGHDGRAGNTVTTVAITGVSGLVGTRVLDLLAAHDGVDRVVGVDLVRPDGEVPDVLEFHRADVAE